MKPQQQKAAEVYAETANASAAAREAKVSRSTVVRWLRDADFLTLVAQATDETNPSGKAQKGLSDLVPKALEVVDKGLAGEATLSAGRLALDVIKVASQINPKSSVEGKFELGSLIEELDKRDANA